MKIYIETYGCAANQADSDEMMAYLEQAGYEIVNSEENADIIIVNTCAVKGPTENKIVYRLKQMKNEKKKVIIAGCLSKARFKYMNETFPNFSIIGPDQIDEIVDIVKEVIEGNRVINIKTKTYRQILLKRVKEAQPIVIQKGCLGNCTYCSTKIARGNLYSFPIDCIKNLVENVVKKGAKRILLTGQDTAAYGFDIGTNLAELLKEITKIEGDFTIRVGMGNPDNVYKILDELIETYKNPKIEKFLHIPVQSGSNKVLREMNRKYTIEQFKEIVKKFRENIPDIKIWTDIIVGYPTETEEDFEETIKLVKEMKFDFINISKFYSRPGTAASRLKQLPSQTIKERSKILAEVYKKVKKTLNKEKN